jgi:DNA-directed RNA polymerase subunit RPC12/RpoP
MVFNLLRFAETASLIYTCSHCNNNFPGDSIRLGCPLCSSTIFKVARLSNIDQPMIEDEDSQNDPYRQKKNNPDRGTQFNNFGGEGTITETIGGPNTRPAQSDRDSNPDGRPLPRDGGEGDHFDPEVSTSQVSDNSPIRMPIPQQDISPFNHMRALNNLRPDDPYEMIRKRRFR